MTNKPYNQFMITRDSFIRTFNYDVKEKDLEWHRDKKDRTIYVIYSGLGWKFQKDNELPQLTISNQSVFNIKANEYHRIIKGDDGPLILYIEEKNGNS